MLGPIDDRILLAFLRYGYLTPDHITRLYYSSGYRTGVYARLKRLAEAGYLEKLALPKPSKSGSVPSVYYLSRQGRQYLRDAELSVPHPVTLQRPRTHSYLFLIHTLAVTDFCISAERLCQERPAVQLAAVLHELVLKTRPVRVPIAAMRDGTTKSQTVAVIPDSWLDFRISREGRTRQNCIALELDRGTIAKGRWQQRVQALVGWVKGPYQQAFQTSSLTIAVVATPGQKRKEWH